MLVLGTGSRYAAKVYSREGFGHLRGGLEELAKGYNKEDEGEWMMVRTRDKGAGIVPSLPENFYNGMCSKDDLKVEQLHQHHLAGLVLLLCSTGDSNKLPLAGIDMGIEAEEVLLKLLVSDNFQCFVAVHTESRRPYGIKVVLVNNDVEKENVFAIIAAAEHKLMSC